MGIATGAVANDRTRYAGEPGIANGRRRIAHNFLAVATSGVLGVAITTVAGIYARRTLGPSAIGQISWSLAVLSYLAILANPGLTTVGQRDLARNPDDAQRSFSLLTTLQICLAVASYGALALLTVFSRWESVLNVLLLLQGLSLFLTACNAGWILQAYERMVAPSIAALVFGALQIPILILFVYGPGDVYIYAASMLLAPLCSSLYNFWYAARRCFIRPLDLRLTLRGSGALLRDAWPLALSQGAILIYYSCDTIILKFTDGDAAVGQYATAYRLMLVPSILTAALWNAYFPAFARSHDCEAEATRLSTEYLTILAWIGMPLSALGWASGRHVVELLYGPAFAPSGVYFEWLCLNVGIVFLNYGVVSTLVPWGHSRLQFKITLAAAITNLSSNLIAIPLFGPAGAIATTIAAELVVLVLGLIVRRRLRIHWHPSLRTIAPPTACSALVAIAIVLAPRGLEPYWWIELSAGAVLLACCLFTFERAVSKRAWGMMRKR